MADLESSGSLKVISNATVWRSTTVFGRPFVKRFALCYQTVVCPVCLSCLSICDVGVLSPNGWMDQDETWHAGHIVLDGDPAPPPPKGHSPQFSAHICCGQMAAWIKMPLGMEVGFGPGDFVLDADPALPPQKKSEPPIFSRPIFIVAKRLDGSRCT